MKRLFLLVLVPFMFISCEKEKVMSLTDIPSEISDYVSTHFTDSPIIQSIKDKDGFELTYDVILDGGFFLEFNRKKEVIDIDGLTKLPDSVIPAKLLDYATSNYPDNSIIGWELDDRNQQIRLENGLELEFTMNGDFLRIDI